MAESFSCSSSSVIQKKCTTGSPVTCVSIVDHVCWFSQGPFLERVVIQEQDHATVAVDRHLVFENGGSIHGMHHLPSSYLTNGIAAVFGGRQIALLCNLGRPAYYTPGGKDSPSMQTLSIHHEHTTSSSKQTMATKSKKSLTFSDWIWDIRLQGYSQRPRRIINDSTSSNNNDSESKSSYMLLLVGLAHNTVQLWQISTAPGFSWNNGTSIKLPAATLTCLGSVDGSSRCITYSMDFGFTSIVVASDTQNNHDTNTTNTQNIVLESTVAYGTPMQQIFVWKFHAELFLKSSSKDSSHLEAAQTDAPTTTTTTTMLVHQINRKGRTSCLLGHEGVIHSVRFASSRNDYIASASDDRSVRLWKNTNDSLWECQWVGWGHTARIWDLAFDHHNNIVLSSGEDGTTKIWEIASGSEMGILRGHSCQSIYRVVVNGDVAMTGGNDGSVAIHDLRDYSTTTTQQQQQQQQKPARIPSEGLSSSTRLEAIPTECGTSATSINHDLATTIHHDNHSVGNKKWSSTFLVPDDRPTIDSTMQEQTKSEPNKDDTCSNDSTSNKRKKKAKKRKVNNQVLVGMKLFVCQDQLYMLVATREGSLFMREVCVHKSRQWFPLTAWTHDNHQDTINPKTGCSMSSIQRVDDDNAIVAVGTTAGDIILSLLHLNALSAMVPEQQQRQQGSFCERLAAVKAPSYRTVQGMAWIEGRKSPPDTLNMVSFHVNAVLWWTISFRARIHKDDVSIKLVFVFQLDSNAIPISFANDSIGTRLFVGDTRGNITMFQYTDSKDSEDDDGEPKMISASLAVNRVHAKEHITDMTLTRNGGSLLSVGNDGCIHEMIIDSSHGMIQKSISVNVSSLTGIRQISSVRRARVVRFEEPVLAKKTVDSMVVIGGYYGNTFVIMNATNGYEFFRADTGGRQRNHDFISETFRNHQTCFCLAICVNRTDGRNEVMIHYRQSYLLTNQWTTMIDGRHQYSQSLGLHGETMYSGCIWPLSEESISTSYAILTGSEDCSSRVSIYQDGFVVASKRLPSQESCVRAVCYSSCSNNTTHKLLVVGGGKLTLQFFLFTPSMCQQTGGADAMDNIHVIFLGYGRTRTKASIDHRINAVKSLILDAKPENNMEIPLHLVAAGDSEGCCNLYAVPERKSRMEHHSWFGVTLKALTSPIISLELIRIQAHILLFAGTTRGEIVMWNLPALTLATEWDESVVKDKSPFLSYHPHQMGTNSISASVMDDASDEGYTTVNICSGGDDQALSVWKLRVAVDTAAFSFVDVTEVCTLPEASLSAIKGVELLGKSGRILSVGYSQKLALWQICEDGEISGLTLVSKSAVDVGDINFLASCEVVSSTQHSHLAVVGGSGMETFTVTRE